MPSTPFETMLTVSGQMEIDRIEAWLKLNLKADWRMEFVGMTDTGIGKSKSGKGIVVRYRFAEAADMERFRAALRDGSVAAAATTPAESAESKPAKGIDGRDTRPSATLRRGNGTATPISAAPQQKAEAFARLAGATIASRRGTESASGLYSLSLERVNENYGDQWPDIEERATQAVRSAIERHLSPADAFTEIKAYNYLLLFADPWRPPIVAT